MDAIRTSLALLVIAALSEVFISRLPPRRARMDNTFIFGLLANRARLFPGVLLCVYSLGIGSSLWQFALLLLAIYVGGQTLAMEHRECEERILAVFVGKLLPSLRRAQGQQSMTVDEARRHDILRNEQDTRITGWKWLLLRAFELTSGGFAVYLALFLKASKGVS